MSTNDLLLLITDNDNWSVAEFEETEHPFLIRFRPDLQPFMDSGRFTKKLTLNWDYQPDTDSGLPSDEDMDLMDDVEDRLLEELEQNADHVLSFVFTGNGIKKWIWYSTDIDQAQILLNNALEAFDELPVSLTAEEESDWKEYREVVLNIQDTDFTEYDDDDE